MLFIASLNSGSNGNCYYIGNESEAILIDAGISCKEVEKRMKRLNLAIQKVKAIFITHEHADHIAGVTKLSKKHDLPVYITPSTLQNSAIAIREELVRPFSTYETITIGNLKVTGFPKQHDAIDPHSFIITNAIVKVGVFTDIGFACRHVVHHFQQCHAAFLESNYDVQMLATGPYPASLQNRIRNGKGHLSNDQALKLFMEHKPTCLSHLILSHLSRTNNKPTIVEDLFKAFAGEVKISVASRNKESEVFVIQSNGHEPTTKAAPILFERQLELF